MAPNARRSRGCGNAVVDYAGVAELKWRALRSAFENFKANARAGGAADFEQFRVERGALLLRFACFEALRHRFTRPWWEWPEGWREPDEANAPSCVSGPTRRGRIRRIRAMDRRSAIGSLQGAGGQARHEGRTLSRRRRRRAVRRFRCLERAGGDLAPSRGRRAARSAQRTRPNWGLAGFNAAGLEIKSFEPFREMLRASMRHAGAIRLDHVLG